MSDPKDNQQLTRMPGPASEPLSLGAVAIDSGAYAKTAADIPSARRQAAEDEQDERAAAVDAEPRPRRLALRFVVGAALAGCIAILGLAAVRTARREAAAGGLGDANRAALVAPAVLAPPPAALAPPPAALAPPPAAPASPPVVPPTSAPAVAAAAPAAPAAPANRATIHAAGGKHALPADGKRSSGAAAVGKSKLAKSDGTRSDGKAKAHAAVSKKH